VREWAIGGCQYRCVQRGQAEPVGQDATAILRGRGEGEPLNPNRGGHGDFTSHLCPTRAEWLVTGFIGGSAPQVLTANPKATLYLIPNRFATAQTICRV